MSPRAYNLGKRQTQVDQARRAVLDAARDLLGGTANFTDFTVDAVARRADVARATVYYQFGAKRGLLEALCDHLGAVGGLTRLPDAFANPDPEQALAAFVAAFGQFWQVDRAAMRRLRALAALDSEVRAVIAARDERRRQGLGVLVHRLVAAGVARADLDQERATRTLAVLTAFETFDALDQPETTLPDVVPEVLALASATLGLAAPPR